MEDIRQSLGATIELNRSDLQINKQNKDSDKITLNDFKESKLNRWQIRNAHYIVFIDNGEYYKLKYRGLRDE